MKTYRVLTGVAVLLSCILSVYGATAVEPSQAETPQRPNVIFFAFDDLCDWVGPLGYAQAKTPNFDRLARQGVSFTRAHTAGVFRTNYACEVLQREQDKPFFLALGLYMPHYPNYAPQKYLDLYDVETIELPPYKADDLDDPHEWTNLAGDPQYDDVKAGLRASAPRHSRPRSHPAAICNWSSQAILSAGS
jgi:arylsulfatase A-like enzyme